MRLPYLTHLPDLHRGSMMLLELLQCPVVLALGAITAVGIYRELRRPE